MHCMKCGWGTRPATSAARRAQQQTVPTHCAAIVGHDGWVVMHVQNSLVIPFTHSFVPTVRLAQMQLCGVHAATVIVVSWEFCVSLG